MTMRAWILPSAPQADGSASTWQAVPGHLVSAEWVDGVGDVADTCTVTLMGVDDGDDVDLLLSTRLSILLAPPADPDVEDLLCFGPYDVEAASVDGEARRWTINGRVGSRFEATLSDRADEFEVYEALEKAITSELADSEPWKGWAAGAGTPPGARVEDYAIADPEFIWGQIRAELVNAVDLKGVRQIIARWGLTVVPIASNVTPVGFDHRVWVPPIYRVDTVAFDFPAALTVRLTTLDAPASFDVTDVAGTVNLAMHHLDAHPAISWPDGLNRPGDFRIRQIQGVRRLFGENLEDNRILSAGTLEPAVYLPADNGPGLIKVYEELARWRLQNESVMITAVRRFAPPYDDVGDVYITPYQLATLGNHQLPPGSHGAVWQVRQVNHAWDDTEAYRQTIKASLWQGSFFRTEGSAVREFLVPTPTS